MPRMFIKVTKDIKVTAMPMYLEDQSDPEEEHYVWAYTIQIENHGDQTVQLLNRTWHITDATGQLQEVQGPGVVGEQPVLQPGDVFQYTSGTVLNTSSGMMVGTYEMLELEAGTSFNIDIPAFSLDSPFQMARPN